MKQPKAIVKDTIIKRAWRAIWDRLEIFQPKEPVSFAKTLGQMQEEISAQLQKKNV